MTFCTFSETNHVLTAFPICEGVGLIDSTFMMLASSRSSSVSGVVMAVPTPIPLVVVSESDEKNEFPVVAEEGEGPLDVVLSPMPKFKTRLFVPEETEDIEEEDRLAVEIVGDGTTNTGDGGGGEGGVTDSSEPIDTLFMQIFVLFSFAMDLSFLASSALSWWNKYFLSISDTRVRSLLRPLRFFL